MPQIGWFELLIIVVIAILVIGPKDFPIVLNKIGITSGTLQDTSGTKGLARGGPMKAGKSYLVGEEGPEIVLPKTSAKVLSNDDSKIYAMLLAANPQLQKVSRARSEKILRNRFPEYFE